MGRVIGTVKELNSTYNSALSLGSYAPVFIGAGLSLGILTILGSSKTYSFPTLSGGHLRTEPQGENPGKAGKLGKVEEKNPGSEPAKEEEKKVVLGGFLLTQDGCKHCPEALSDLAEHIHSGALRVVNIESKEGEALSRKYNVVRTPSIVPAVKKGGRIETLPTNTDQELPIIVGLAMANKEKAESLAGIPEQKRDEAWFVPAREEGFKSFQGQSEADYCSECLLGSTRLYTINSTEQIGSITTHSLLTHEAIYTNPSKTFRRPYDGEILSLSFRYTNIPLKITPEHPILCALNVREPQSVWRELGIDESTLAWTPAGKLTNRDFIAFPRIRATKDVELVSPELAELLGWYLSEGCYQRHDRGESVTFSLGHHEEARIARVASLIAKLFGKAPSITRKGTATRITLSSIYYAGIFKQFGSCATEKKIPNWILYLPENKQVALLTGMFGGDGCISPKSIHYGTASRALAYELRLLLFRLGILHGLYEREMRPGMIDGRAILSSGPFYDICIGGDAARKMASLLKWDYDGGQRTSGNFGYVTENFVMIPLVACSTEHFSGMVYNLHVPGQESYVSIHGALHNCIVKHFSRASTYLTEGIDRSLKNGQGVESKVREALKEIEGIKDDLPKKKVPSELQERFDQIDRVHREISKEIGAKGLGIKADKESLREIRGRVDDLLNYAYDTWGMVRKGEEAKHG